MSDPGDLGNESTRTHGQDPRSDAPPAGDAGPLPPWIGGYRILGVLGRGGMGVVYEAEQQSPTRVVALKVIRGEASVDDVHIAMFRREVEVLARLEHPMIARIYESGRTDEGRHFFAMELVRGVTLSELLRRRDAPIDRDELRRRLTMFAAIADAVHYAHQKGVIHRDLKPSNLIVTEDAPGTDSSTSAARLPQLKILDFGLARITDGDVVATRVTEIGMIKGTLPYMSPEQARGNPDEIDVRTDVYALGVILHEMLTGKLPHDLSSISIVEALRIIEQARPRPLHEAWTGTGRVDEDLDTIVAKALEKDAKDRYGSAAALAEDVRRYLGSQPILARPPSTLYQLRKLVRRNPLPAGFAGLVLLLLVAFAGAMAYQARRIAHERDRAQAEADKSTAINDFLQKTLETANPWAAGGERGVTIEEALDRSASRIEKDFAGQPVIEAAVRETMGTTYGNLGQYDKAETNLRRSLDLRVEHLGPHDPLTAAAWGKLSRIYHATGRYDEAIQAATAGVEAQRAGGAPKALELADRLDDLGFAYFFAGKPQEAEKPAREAVEISRAQPGPTRILAEGLTLLGDVVASKGKDGLDEAITLSSEGVEVSRKAMGENTPELDLAKNSLAILLMQKGDLERAEKLLREIQDSTRARLGEDHPLYAVAVENLGNVYFQEGKLDRTIELLGEAAAVRKKAFGPNHPTVGRTLANKATVLWRAGRLEESAASYREALALMRAGMGDHPDVAYVLATYADLLEQRGDRAGAEEALRESLRIRRKVLGDKDRLTASTAVDLGLNLSSRGIKTDEARTLLRDGAAALAAAAGPDDPRVQAAKKALGEAKP